MIITVDTGNSNIVFGGYCGQELTFTARLSTSLDKTVEEYAVLIREIFDVHSVSIKDIDGLIISSVVPHLISVLSDAFYILTKKKALVVGPGMKTGINIKIDNPAQLGSDILVSSVACSSKYKTPCIMIDMGTATTLFLLDENNNMLGGAIMPGVKISINALSDKTAQLPHIALEKPEKTIGTNTTASMQAGIMYGTAGMLDGIIERMEEEIGKKCTVIATGGLSPKICALAKHKIICDEYLLLEGLRILYEKNTK